MGLRLIAYIRVSTKSQSDNTSFESQSMAITKFCCRMDHELVEIRKETQSASGKKARAIFDSVLQDILNGKADGLVVSKLDRFARSSLEGLQVAQMLMTAKKDLLVVDLGFDTSTPIGRCIFSVLLAFAELERNMISARADEGRQRAREGGYLTGGRLPYGYFSSGPPGQRVLKPHPEQYPHLLLMLALHEQGMSFKAIAKHFNSCSIATKFGGEWKASTIGDILTRPRKIPGQIHPQSSRTSRNQELPLITLLELTEHADQY